MSPLLKKTLLRCYLVPVPQVLLLGGTKRKRITKEDYKHLDKKVKAMSGNSLATRIARQSTSGLYIYRLVCRVPDVLLKGTRYLFTRSRLESIREIGGDFLLK